MSDELNTLLEVDALPADSVIADVDGFVFQVQEEMMAGHVCLRGIQGMGFGTSDMSLSYPVTILRLAGGGRLGEDRTESALASERAARTTAEATIAQVRAVRDLAIHAEFCEEGYRVTDPDTGISRELVCDCWVREFDTILAAAPSAALDVYAAQVKAEALEEAAEQVLVEAADDRDGDLDAADKVMGWLRQHAAEIRKAAG